MGELIALRWRDVDFTGNALRVGASYSSGDLTTPKSGKVHAVPMAPDVASALAGLGARECWVGDEDALLVARAFNQDQPGRCDVPSRFYVVL